MTGLFAPALLGAGGEADKKPSRDEPALAFLQRHCVHCHSEKTAKGHFRIDTLTADLANAANRSRWEKVLDRVRAGEMPPKERPRPDSKEVDQVGAWFAARIDALDEAKGASGRVVLRRLNRVEYENTIRDLFGIDAELREHLPLDASLHGFDNVGEALHVSSFLMERYLEAADAALAAAIPGGPQPPLVKKRYLPRDERHIKITKESVFRHQEDGVVFFSSSLWHNVVFSQFYPKDRGRYRFRISAQAVQSEGKPVAYRVLAGPMLMGAKNRIIGYFDAPADRPHVLEFVEPLEARNTIALIPWGLAPAQTVAKIGADKYEGPGLLVHWVEVEGPLHDSWPPPSHRRLFGDLPLAKASPRESRLEVVSKNPHEDAAKVLLPFARRAFRRSVTIEEVKPYLDLVRARMAKGHSFEQALRVGLKAMLVSPEFLYLREPVRRGAKEAKNRLDDFAIASRLSYFLWSTMPDEELLTLAEAGRLGDRAILRAQVERMLKHPKASAFTENFLGQWLSLRDIDFTAPDFRLYPEFDELLKVSMVKETHLFFEELLKHDLGVSNIVSADFSMLNGRLAKHYGIAGVEGQEFRKVKLTPESRRGGILTMASVLKVTANGTYTSPVVRGAWVLDRILGRPPSPPPEGVPAVEPDIRGAVTIREQLAKHRTQPTCASCHQRIDPPGFALESYDVIGGWRDHYRTVGKGAPVILDGRRMLYQKGPRVDPSDVLPDGRRFADIDEFKKLLLEEREQIARAFTERLLTYATGGAPRPSDRPAIDAILAAARDRDHGLRTLIHEMVQSEPFLTR